MSQDRHYSARLDRFYISHSEADYASLTPTITVNCGPIEASCNVHKAVCLEFCPVPAHTAGPKQRRLVSWAVTHKLFQSFFSSHYTHLPANIMQRRALFKRSLYQAQKDVLKLQAKDIDKAHEIQICAKALRTLTSPHTPDLDLLRLLQRKFPRLSSLAYQDCNLHWHVQGLRLHINSLFKSHGRIDPALLPTNKTGPTLSPFDPLYRLPTLLESNKLTLPSSRARTTRLRCYVLTPTKPPLMTQTL